MFDSTLSRFQGGICGALISTLSEVQQPVSYLAVVQAQKLIELGKLDTIDDRDAENLTTSQIALANLPLILFFHENPQLLTEKFTEIVIQLNKSTETLRELLIWAKAIALAMTEKIKPQELILELLQENTQTPLEQQLELIATYLKQDYSLIHVVSKLSRRKQPQQTPIALALYCFLFTPKDFTSAITRASYSGYQPQITSALTGALAGVYNGYHKIPLTLRLENNVTLANQLYLSWCGATPTVSQAPLLSAQPIGEAGSLQPRAQLQLISQQDSKLSLR